MIPIHLELLDLSSVLYLLPIGLVGVLSWAVWLVRRSLSRRYRPIVNDFRTTTSVVVPVYREDPAVLLRCLRTWRAANPDEIVFVVDVGDAELTSALREIGDPRLRVISFRHQGKRSALGVGIRAAVGEIVVLTDSDTQWEGGLLEAVQMPFVDPRVGGVGTRQSVYGRSTSVWRRVADWLVDVRYLDYVPAMGRAGSVACLSGRTAAYRRSVVTPLLPQLEYEYFLGRLCEAGDDGRLTWLVLNAGYKTVHQANALALSMFPDTFVAFLKQRIRWSRNSYRCYLTAAYKGWLWRQPFVTQVTVMQVMVTPVSMTGALAYLGLAVIHSAWIPAAVGALWFFLGRSLRGLSHLREHPGDLWIVPVVALTVALVAVPIKLFAFVTMNQHGWLTRSSDRIGGEGQTEATLSAGLNSNG